MTNLDILITASEPWIMSFDGRLEEIQNNILSTQADNPGLRLIILNGKSMRTLDAFYDELTEKLELPDYFGRNYDALDECITDFRWMDFSSMTLLIRDGDEVLAEESQNRLASFLDILWDAGAEWSHPISQSEPGKRSAIPFHTILIQPDTITIRSCGFGHAIPDIALRGNAPKLGEE